MTDKDTPQLGKLLRAEDDTKRDAVHFALAPVVAGEKVYPGQHVGVGSTPGGVGVYSRSDEKIGIIDPFLGGPVYPGEYCWLLLYPNTVTSIRHEWTHPSFDSVEPSPDLGPPKEALVALAKNWMENFAEECSLSYDDVMKILSAGAADSSYFWTEHGTEDARDAAYAPENRDQFWKHYTTITGVTPEDPGCVPFNCSC